MTRINPLFYTDPMPAGFYDRQTLYLSFTPFASYRISPELSMGVATKFDIEHRSPDPDGALHFGSALDDTLKLSATLSPQVAPLFLSIGGFYQMLIWNPSIDTSILGANFSISF